LPDGQISVRFLRKRVASAAPFAPEIGCAEKLISPVVSRLTGAWSSKWAIFLFTEIRNHDFVFPSRLIQRDVTANRHET
jgi:hypothetical protein